MVAEQALQQPGMYAGQLTPEQQAALFQHEQAQAMAAAHLQQQQEAQAQGQKQSEIQQGQGSSEVASQVSASGSDSGPSAATATPSKPVSKVTALLQKSANNPLVQIIKPLFKRNKDQKESEKQKKP